MNWKRLSEEEPRTNDLIILCDKRDFDEKYFVGYFEYDPDVFLIFGGGGHAIHIGEYKAGVFWDDFDQHRCDD